MSVLSFRTLAMVVVATTVGLAARLAHFLAIRNHPFYDLYTIWEQSDMHQFVAWARHLAGGDWLDLETFRPYFDWQERIAPAEVWSSWFGAHVYYQPPLYPYLAAVAFRLTGGFDLFRLSQVALGAVNCGLIALLAARLVSVPAGWIAGLAAALYAPFIVYDAELLRGTLVMTTQLLLLLALARLDDGVETTRLRRRAFLAGLALGVAYLAEPSVLLFAPFAMGVTVWAASLRTPGRTTIGTGGTTPLVAAGMLLGGVAAALIPLMARNVAVGAPLVSNTTRGPLAFVMGNAPDAISVGAFLPPSTNAILSESGYGMGATIAATLRRYQGDYRPLLEKQWLKMKALWGDFEVPDNPNFYFAARISPIAAWGLRFLPVAALGVVGLGLALAGAATRPSAALLPLYLLSCVGLFLLAHVVSRYRQPMVAALMVLAAQLVVWTVASLRSPDRQRRARGAAALVAALVAAVLLPKEPPAGYGYLRPAEFVQVSRLREKLGDVDGAAAEVSSAIEAARREEVYTHWTGRLYYTRGMIEARAGRYSEAAGSFREALREEPDLADASRALDDALRMLAAGPPPGSSR